MINDLFDIFPEPIAFKILTYQPHKTADMISVYWMKKLHKKKYSKVMRNITIIKNDMIDWIIENEINDDFYHWYMYNVSPRDFDNIHTMMERDITNQWMEWFEI
jgi:hypothetical protein